MMLSRPEGQSDGLHLSLLLAEGIHWLGRDLRRDEEGQVDAFLSVPPEKPSLEAYTRLANLLLAPSGLQATLTDEGSWAITGIHAGK
jgi:hypothetical protein